MNRAESSTSLRRAWGDGAHTKPEGTAPNSITARQPPHPPGSNAAGTTKLKPSRPPLSELQRQSEPACISREAPYTLQPNRFTDP